MSGAEQVGGKGGAMGATTTRTTVINVRGRDRKRPAGPGLDQVNAVLATFRCGEGLRLELRGTRLWYATKYGERLARLNSTGQEIEPGYGRLGLGGTQAMALGQLVRWFRGQPRRPIDPCWIYWTSKAVGLGDAETLRLLEEHGYGDPVATSCVLCLAPRPSDWWSRDRVVGPCCRFGNCEAAGRTRADREAIRAANASKANALVISSASAPGAGGTGR